MKKWQKTVGIIIISALIIAHIWAFIDYLKFSTAAEFWCAEITQAAFFDNIFNFRQHFGATIYYQYLILFLLSGYSWLFARKEASDETDR